VWWGGLGGATPPPPDPVGAHTLDRPQQGRGVRWGGSGGGSGPPLPPDPGLEPHTLDRPQQDEECGGGVWGGAAPLPPQIRSERTLSIGHNRDEECGGGSGESGAAPPRSGRRHTLDRPQQGRECGGGVWGRSGAAPPQIRSEGPLKPELAEALRRARYLYLTTYSEAGKPGTYHLVLVSRGRGCRLLHHQRKSLKVRRIAKNGRRHRHVAARTVPFRGAAELGRGPARSREDPPRGLLPQVLDPRPSSGWGAISARASRRERASSSVSAHHALVAGRLTSSSLP